MRCIVEHSILNGHAQRRGSLANAPEPLATGYWFKLMTSMRSRALKKKAAAAKAQ